MLKTDPKVRIDGIEMVPTASLVPNPKNPNHHPPEQIERLASIIEFQGWRRPITVSKRSGFVIVGHGRLAAAMLRGWPSVPVTYQEYENEAQEYADLVADNAIDDWATLDLSQVNADLPEFGPDFEIDLLGIKDFTLDPAERPPDKTSQADGIGAFLSNDMRYLQLVYPLETYDHVVSRLDELGKQHGITDFSTLVAHLIGVNAQDLPD
jgi:hypothetical protein